MSRYLNRDCKLTPFTGNILNSFVLSERGLGMIAKPPKPKPANENVLLTRIEDRGDNQQNAVPDLKKYPSN